MQQAAKKYNPLTVYVIELNNSEFDMEVLLMNFIKMLREDNDLSDLLCDVCDIEIFSEFKTPQDECGHLTYNIFGKTFAKAASGSEYILLEDGSIGFWGSEGKCGRIADNLKEFFEFVINCPYWENLFR